MDAQERIDEINKILEAIKQGWPFFMAELEQRKALAIAQLIGQESEQVRGRIKALNELLDMPEMLVKEREGISAGLAE